jgi:hypothetical protein
MRERMPFDITDMYEQFSGVSLTEKQLDEQFFNKQSGNKTTAIQESSKTSASEIKLADRPKKRNKTGLA